MLKDIFFHISVPIFYLAKEIVIPDLFQDFFFNFYENFFFQILGMKVFDMTPRPSKDFNFVALFFSPF
jgi:hypothetical protein